MTGPEEPAAGAAAVPDPAAARAVPDRPPLCLMCRALPRLCLTPRLRLMRRLGAR